MFGLASALPVHLIYYFPHVDAAAVFSMRLRCSSMSGARCRRQPRPPAAPRTARAGPSRLHVCWPRMSVSWLGHANRSRVAKKKAHGGSFGLPQARRRARMAGFFVIVCCRSVSVSIGQRVCERVDDGILCESVSNRAPLIVGRSCQATVESPGSRPTEAAIRADRCFNFNDVLLVQIILKILRDSITSARSADRRPFVERSSA